MKTKFRILAVLAMTLALVLCANSALACTIFMVGKDATTDGSTISTHNDDSTGADFRLWIIPSMEGGEGVTRDLVVDSHNYGDFGDYPNTKDYGNGYAVTAIDQPEDTYAYFHSRYSFINEKGVSMGEATFSCDKEFYDSETYAKIYEGDGLIDCWNAQDIALERASTAREAVEIMGELIETYKWGDPGETINISDGEECWVFEAYGGSLWAAVRLPSNSFFVAANRARIADLEAGEEYLCSADLKSFAVENGLWSEDSGETFSPADLYAPYHGDYSRNREWRGFSLAAPSQEFDLDAYRYPLYIVPDEKLSVKDIFDFCGDYYEGTDLDASLYAVSGDFGNPLNFNSPVRTINMYRTCYVMLTNVKAWLPDEVKCLVWYGYGAPDSTFITPLWPTLTEMPSYYDHGSRYEDLDRTSGWWINTLVQDTATRNYVYAIQVIEERRDARAEAIFAEVAELQEKWAEMIKNGQTEEAIAELTTYANATANEWFEIWTKLSDELLSDLVWSRVNVDNKISGGNYSEWYQNIMDSAEKKPVETEEEAA